MLKRYRLDPNKPRQLTRRRPEGWTPSRLTIPTFRRSEMNSSQKQRPHGRLRRSN